MRSRQAGPEYQIEMIPNDVGKQSPAQILIPANDLVNCIATYSNSRFKGTFTDERVDSKFFFPNARFFS
jgi:hypothetical protein